MFLIQADRRILRIIVLLLTTRGQTLKRGLLQARACSCGGQRLGPRLMLLFMTLSHHTRTREGEVQPGGTGRSRSLFSLVPLRDCCTFWNEMGGF